MTCIENQIFDYDPGNHRSDLPCVFSGFGLFLLVLTGLFLI